MNDSFDEYELCHLKQELETLRKKMEELEARRSTRQIGRAAAYRPALSRKPTLIMVMAILGALLALGVLGAESKHDALFIDQNGNVGINQTKPEQPLDVNGKVLVRGPIQVDGNAAIRDEVGSGSLSVKGSATVGNGLTVTGDLVSNGDAKAGNSSLYFTNPDHKFSAAADDKTGWAAIENSSNYNSLMLLGRTTSSKLRVVSIWDKVGIGTGDPQAKLDVAGDVRIQGKVSSLGRYQKDDEAETTYQIPPPYHLTLTAAKYAGCTKTIPQDVLVGLCGRPSGCEVRLAMTRWDGDIKTAAASRSILFYYSASDGRWRGSNDEEGVDGDGQTKHVLNIWNACYFTDGTYSKYSDLGDKQKGMQVLLWNGNGTNASRTCELTLSSAGGL